MGFLRAFLIVTVFIVIIVSIIIIILEIRDKKSKAKTQTAKSRVKKSSKRKRHKINLKTMDLILVIVFVSLFLFTVYMINVFTRYGSVPDTLVTCVFATLGGECGVMGWIKTSKIRSEDRAWQEKDAKERRKKNEVNTEDSGDSFEINDLPDTM